MTDEALEGPSEIGSVRSFGDYELLEQLGRGGMGIVYKARQISLNRTVALKMISAGEFATPSAVQRFHIEAEAAAKLDHPNIVPIYEVGLHRGQHYFSMKFVEGRSLADEIREGKFQSFPAEKSSSKSAARQQQAAIARLIATVARSVHYAHQHGVLHRDLKPANILLDRAGQQHLTDFGLAKILEHEVGVSASNELLGTPSYMSPEQAAGKPATRASDIYSLGVILYELLTGRPPFHADTPMETMRRVTQEDPTHPTTLNRQADPELATICLKCLEKDPLRRYSSAEAMAEDLERWLRHEPIHARRASSSEKLMRWCQRKPALAAVALLLILLSIISTITAIQFAKLSEQRGKAATAEKNARVASEEERHNISEALKTFKELIDLWSDATSNRFVDVTAQTRATLEGRLPEKPTSVRRITFGVYTYYTPTKMLEKFMPILTYLETNITTAWQTQTLRIDFHVYRSYSHALKAFENGELDFMRMGPSSYVLAREKSPRVRLLASQNDRIRGAIFVLKDSNLYRFADLRGKIFAFGDPESTTGNFLSKLVLLDAGLHASDLSDDSRHFQSHDQVIAALINHACAAGAVNASLVDESKFRILTNLETGLYMPWVGKAGLDPRLVDALQRSLLELHDRTILKALDRSVTGFQPVEASEYDQLEKDMERSRAFGELKP